MKQIQKIIKTQCIDDHKSVPAFVSSDSLYETQMILFILYDTQA